MGSYHCPRCADLLGLRKGIDTSNLLGSTYQQDKFTKHTSTSPSSSEPVQSVFDSNTTQYYADCINEAVDLGFVEIDNQGRQNVIFCPSTGSSIGNKYKWGQLATRVDTVVVVKTSDPAQIHPLVKNSSDYSTYNCANCGGPLL